MRCGGEGGVDFLETADVYPLGVGGWLEGKRQRFILATNCPGQVGAQAWDHSAAGLIAFRGRRISNSSNSAGNVVMISRT